MNVIFQLTQSISATFVPPLFHTNFPSLVFLLHVDFPEFDPEALIFFQ